MYASIDSPIREIVLTRDDPAPTIETPAVDQTSGKDALADSSHAPARHTYWNPAWLPPWFLYCYIVCLLTTIAAIVVLHVVSNVRNGFALKTATYQYVYKYSPTAGKVESFVRFRC